MQYVRAAWKQVFWCVSWNFIFQKVRLGETWLHEQGERLDRYSHPMEHLGSTKTKVRLLVKKKVYTLGKRQHFEPKVMEVFGSDDFPDFKWVIFRFHVYFQGSSQELWIFDFCGAKLRPVSRGWAGLKRMGPKPILINGVAWGPYQMAL